MRAAAPERRGTARPLPLSARLAAIAVLAAGLAAMLTLLLDADGWSINRANVRAWTLVAGPLGLMQVVSPEQFAVVANVVLFVPLFAALALLVPRWWWVLLAAAGSTAVELYQLSLDTRLAQVSDVLANTAGAALGVALGIWLHRGLTRSLVPPDALEPADGNGAADSAGASAGLSCGPDAASPPSAPSDPTAATIRAAAPAESGAVPDGEPDDQD